MVIHAQPPATDCDPPHGPPPPSLPSVSHCPQWTVSVSRTLPAPADLPLRCAFFSGEGAAPADADASYGSLPLVVPATMAQGSTTATCTLPPVYYLAATAAGSRVQPRVQVFAVDEEGVLSRGLLGQDAPRTAAGVPVSHRVGGPQGRERRRPGDMVARTTSGMLFCAM